MGLVTNISFQAVFGRWIFSLQIFSSGIIIGPCSLPKRNIEHKNTCLICRKIEER